MIHSNKNLFVLLVITWLITGFPLSGSAKDNYIFCSDMSSDIDDLGAMAVLLHEHSQGRINLVAAIQSVREGKGYRVMRHIGNWYQNYTMRIGINRSTTGLLPKDYNWIDQYIEKYSVPDFIPEDATDIIIEILNSYPDVVLVVVGPQTNIANAERISPGILQKAKKITVMGGRFPSGLPEFNVVNDIESAQLVQPYVDEYYGGELGNIITGQDSIFLADTPVRFGYWTYSGGTGRKSWDLVAAAGSNTGDIWFNYIKGTTSILPDGSNTFTPAVDGVNTYASYKPGKDIELQSYLNSLIGKDAATLVQLQPPQIIRLFLLLRNK